MKKIFIFLIFISFSFAYNVKDLPDNFMKSFDKFKESRFSKNATLYYSIQLPYFRYLNSFERFKSYVNNLSHVKEVKIVKVKEVNKDFISILVRLKLKNSKDVIYYDQDWFKVDKNFFLFLKEKMLFRY